MSKKLNNIRKEIDIIDDQIHDLFMHRAELVSSVAAAKKKAGLQIVHPAREAKLIRRILSRHKGALPRSTIVRIWRELISSVSLLQTGLSVVVSSDKYWDMAKNYFGSEIPMKKVSNSKNALFEVRENDVYFAVMPWPEPDEDEPWWSNLFNQKEKKGAKLSIICALPYGKHKELEALIVSMIDFMPSGNDISFIGLELTSELSRDLIITKAKDTGLYVKNLYGYKYHYLLEVKGFIEDTSKLADSFKDNCRYCGVAGGYPVVEVF